MLKSNNHYVERKVFNFVFHTDSSLKVLVTTRRNIFKTGSNIKPIENTPQTVLDKMVRLWLPSPTDPIGLIRAKIFVQITGRFTL